MSSPNFGAILDKPSTEIERPKPLPAGTYTMVVKGMPRYDKTTKKGTEYAEFILQPLSAGEDVDEGDLAAMGGLTNKTLKDTYYLTEDAIWRLKKFCDDCGVEEEGDVSLRQRIESTNGCQILVHVKHEASQDGQTIYAKVGSTAAVE